MFVLAGPGNTPVRLVRGRSVELMVKPLLREGRKEAGQEGATKQLASRRLRRPEMIKAVTHLT